MEITRAIKDAETALRDFLEYILERNHGENWPEHCGLPPEKIQIWKERKAQAEAEATPISAPEKLMYHAPFEDLSEVITENWSGDLQPIFPDLDRTTTYLRILESYRNPDNHLRELFIHEKHLLLGITGEIRAQITAFRSLLELGKQGFPRIEYVKDDLGNVWVPGKPRRVKTNLTLRPGDTIEFIVKASDPEEMPLEYKIHGEKWQTGNILLFEIGDKHIKKQAQISITIRSSRKFHAFPLGYDDRVVFEYQIVPRSKSQ